MDIDSAGLALLVASAFVGYLFGSLPLAYLVARAVGVNIFEVGTGNPGAANTFRAISKKLGALVFVGDVCKGVAAVLFAAALGVDEDLRAIVAAAAITGHMYPVFLRFRGGDALATAIGGIVTIVPIAGGIGLASGSGPSERGLAPRFLLTPPRKDAPALRQSFAASTPDRGLLPSGCPSCSVRKKGAARRPPPLTSGLPRPVSASRCPHQTRRQQP